MRTIRNILVATDFSDAAARALDEALGLAAALGARVTLLHVYQLPLPIPEVDAAYEPTLILRTLEQDAQAQLEGARASARQRWADAVVLDVKTRFGVPSDEIVAEAQRGGFDLVVMGTQGRTGIRRFFLGSIAERVVRLCPVPVLTIHPEADTHVAPAG